MTLDELVRRSEASRTNLTQSHAHVRRALDLPARIRGSLREAPGKWLGGSLVAGFVASFFFKRRKAPAKVKKLKRQRGFLLTMLTLGVTMGKPLAKAYAAKMLKDYLATRFVTGSQVKFARGGKPPY